MLDGAKRDTVDTMANVAGREIILIAVVALVAGSPLLCGQALGGHDIVSYLIYGQQTAANFREGILLPAWAGDFYAGCGGPALLFYPPAVNMSHALLALIGIPLILALSLAAILTHFASGLAVRCWLRASGRSAAALPAALFYMVAPYRVINYYERTALAEHWALILPPLILWAAANDRLRPGRRAVLIGGLVAALLLTNLPLAVLFGLGFAGWLVLPAGPVGRRWVVAGGAGLGFGLAAFALVPQALSSRLLHVGLWYGSEAAYFKPSFNTLFNSGAIDPEYGFRVSLGLVLTLALQVTAFMLLDPARRRRPATRLCFAAGVLCLVATLGPLGPLWDALPVISRIQFPWRLAGPLTFTAALVLGSLSRRRGWVVASLGIACGLPFYAWNTNLPLALYRQTKPEPVAPGTVFPSPEAAYEACALRGNWRHWTQCDLFFLPASASLRLFDEMNGKTPEAFRLIRDRAAVLVEAPSTAVEVVQWRSHRRSLRIRAPVAGTLLWRCLYFPEMAISVDGQPTNFVVDSATGLLTHRIPAGEHLVVWTWSPFPALAAARATSLLALLIALALWLRSRGGAGETKPARNRNS